MRCKESLHLLGSSHLASRRGGTKIAQHPRLRRSHADAALFAYLCCEKTFIGISSTVGVVSRCRCITWATAGSCVPSGCIAHAFWLDRRGCCRRGQSRRRCDDCGIVRRSCRRLRGQSRSSTCSCQSGSRDLANAAIVTHFPSKIHPIPISSAVHVASFRRCVLGATTKSYVPSGRIAHA